AEALPLLQKAAADLERSLEDRGIDLRGLDFGLAPDAEAGASRDDGRAQQRAGAFTFAGGRGEHDGDGDDDPLTTAMTATPTVEQLTNLAKSTTQSAKSAAMTEAVGLLGRTVSYLQDGAAVQGTVERVDVGSNGPTLTIGGQSGITTDSLVDVA